MSSSCNEQGSQVPPSHDGTEEESDGVESPCLKLEPDAKSEVHPVAAALDPFFNFELVVFKVENTLFRVPKLAFLDSSEPENAFFQIFSLPPPDPHSVEGASLANPIVLENESSRDFRAFLHTLYPWFTHTRTFEENISVLRLATKWSFDKIRSKALEDLMWTMNDKGPALIIHTGNEFKVPSWLVSGLTAIVLNEELDINQLRSEPYHLDWETIAKIYHIQDLMANDYERETARACSRCLRSTRCRCRAKNYVNAIFSNEIAAAKHPNEAADKYSIDAEPTRKKKGKMR